MRTFEENLFSLTAADSLPVRAAIIAIVIVPHAP